MTRIFGTNGTLSQTADLKEADDARAYAEKDPDFRYRDVMASISEEFPDLTDMQLENIIRGLSGGYKRDISANAAKQFAAVRNALPPMSETQLLQIFDHLSSHGAREITPEALKQYKDIFNALSTQMIAIQDLMSNNPLNAIRGFNTITSLFQSVTGHSARTADAETAERMKEFFSHLGHALPIACAVKEGYCSVNFKPEDLPAFSGLAAAFKNSINSLSAKMSPELKSRLELKLSFADAFLKEIRDHMRTGSSHAAVIDPDAKPAPEMQKTMNQIMKMAVLREDKTFNEKLDNAVSSLNLDGPQAKKLAKMMIRDLVLCNITDNDSDPMTNYRTAITEVTGTIRNDELFKQLLSADAMTQEHLTKVVKNTLTKEVISNHYDTELKSSKGEVTPTTIHKVFLRDSLSAIKIGNTDFSKIKVDDNIQKEAEKAFNEIVPEAFRGFVSSFMMQGGASRIFYDNIRDPKVKQEDRIHPEILTPSEMYNDSECDLNVSMVIFNSINKRPDNTQEIRTVVQLNGGPQMNFDGMNNLKFLSSDVHGNSAYMLKSFEVVPLILMTGWKPSTAFAICLRI